MIHAGGDPFFCPHAPVIAPLRTNRAQGHPAVRSRPWESVRSVTVVNTAIGFLLFLNPMALWADGEPNGRQVMERVDQNYSFRDQTADLDMILQRKGATVEERGLKVWLLKDKSKGEETLLKFYKPAVLLNTGLLSHRDAVGVKSQWLYIPAQRRTRRVSSSNKTQRFMGSEYTYEDLEVHNLDDADYHLLKTETKGGVKYYLIDRDHHNSSLINFRFDFNK